jgi:hypothetical protein
MKPEAVWNLWEHQGGWGHNLSIEIPSSGDPYVIGHLPFRYSVKDGHELRCKMASGKIGRYEIRNVHYYMDPKDMLKFELKWQGYLE